MSLDTTHISLPAVPEDIGACVFRAFVGEVYDDLIAVWLSYDGNRKEIFLLYYLNRESNEYDKIGVESVKKKICSSCGNKVKMINVEIRMAHDTISNMKGLTETVIRRDIDHGQL